MNILIASLHSNLIESDVLRLFLKYGEVESVALVRDKLNNRSLGRALVVMPVRQQGEQAVASLDHTSISGKQVTVTEVLYDPAPNSSWSFTKDA